MLISEDIAPRQNKDDAKGNALHLQALDITGIEIQKKYL